MDFDYARALEAQEDALAALGDPRRCARHPSVVIGSPCGMFDGLCGICESEADDADAEEGEAD